MQFLLQNIKQDFSDLIEKIIGEENIKIFNVCSITAIKDNYLVWIKNERLNNLDFDFTKKTLIITEGDVNVKLPNSTIIVSKNAKYLFLSILKKYYTNKVPTNTIGVGCEIDETAKIYSGVRIGNNVKIHAGAVIGTQPDNFSKHENNLIRFSALSIVEISDGVEIGANVVIVKGALSPTKIGEQTKITAGTYIGNGCVIGKRNFIAANCTINGSCKIGDDNFIGAASVIRQKIEIGNNNTIGCGSVVVKNIENDKTAYGVPAKIRT